MKGCLVALGILTGLVILAVAFFRLNFYDTHVRYRLTVEVQDGDQVKTGSSVIEVLYNIEPTWSPSHFNSFPIPVGYAPTVDLGEKGMLFLTFSDAARPPAQRAQFKKEVFCPFDDIGCLPFAAYRKSGGGLILIRRMPRFRSCFARVGRAT
ncbi:hypothetical protein [Bradyrhizobium sp. McL0616]|uniref:hypothetical protein n=1 Tax=Bradyrhizobium sp. McL0616 TaxID=3415674 RepID=UPI003CFB1957